jgi:hypothetical protein
MGKNNKINSKTLTGWLLLLLFVLPPAVRAVHACQCVYCHNTENDGQNSHAHHDCKACAICQFILSPFMKTESIEFDFTAKTVDSNIFTYRENINLPVTYICMLRAPPCTKYPFRDMN